MAKIRAPKKNTPWTLQVQSAIKVDGADQWQDRGTYDSLSEAKKAARAMLVEEPLATLRLAKIIGPITAQKVERTRVVGL